MADSPVKTDNGPDLARLVVSSGGPDETRRLAARLSNFVRIGDLIVLTGDLGAGKTCFTQGLGAGLGVTERITSPTFTLANRYVATAPAAGTGLGRRATESLILHHLDVYRLESVAETIDLDLPELLESGVTVIEWGEQISEVLPADHLVIALRFPDVDATAMEDDNGPATDPAADGAAGRYVVDESADTVRIIEFTAAGGSWPERLAALQVMLGEETSAGTGRDGDTGEGDDTRRDGDTGKRGHR